ncbi:MAG: PAS domain-containing protein [Planctomycetota bacterium]
MVDPDSLRASHGQLPAVLLSKSSILIVLDHQGLVLLWNVGAERVFGLREDAIRGKSFSRCAIAWDWDRIEKLAPGGISQREQRIIQPFMRRDHTTGLVAMLVSPQFDRQGALSGCLWLGSDAWRASLGPAQSGVAQPGTRDATHSRLKQRTPLPESAIPEPANEFARKYPVHISFLDSHLLSHGEDLTHWRIDVAVESGLDERGMAVTFTLVRRQGAKETLRRRVLIASGELVEITAV